MLLRRVHILLWLAIGPASIIPDTVHARVSDTLDIAVDDDDEETAPQRNPKGTEEKDDEPEPEVVLDQDNTHINHNIDLSEYSADKIAIEMTGIEHVQPKEATAEDNPEEDDSTEDVSEGAENDGLGHTNIPTSDVPGSDGIGSDGETVVANPAKPKKKKKKSKSVDIKETVFGKHPMATSISQDVQQAKKKTELAKKTADDYVLDGKWEEAAHILQGLVDSENDIDAVFRLARIYTDNALYKRALILMQDAIKKYPANAEIQSNLGWIYERTNKPSMAVEAYSQATKLNSREARYWFNLGNALMAVGAAPQAQGAYEKAYNIRPNDSDIALNYGITTRNKAIIEKHSAKSALGKQVLAQIYWQEQNLREACDMFAAARKWASVDPDVVLQEVLCRLQIKGIQGKLKNVAGWKMEIEEALKLRRDKNAVFAFLAKTDPKTAKKARERELKELGYPIHDKLDLIRFEEQRQKWQSEYAHDCVSIFGMDGLNGHHDYNVNVFPSLCSYGIVWSYAWHKIIKRWKDGALDNMKATKQGFRDFIKSFAVAIVGSGRGGSCIFAWLQGRECVAVDVLCNSMRHAGDEFYCRQLGWNYLPPEKKKKKPENKSRKQVNDELDSLDDPDPVWPETPEDEEYALYMRQKQIGAVVLLSQFWHPYHVTKEIEFWSKELVASGDLFVWKEDYAKNKDLINEKFDVLFYHGMQVSWSKEEKMMIQLQKKLDDLKAQVKAEERKEVEQADAYFEFVNAKQKAELKEALGNKYDPNKTIAANVKLLYDLTVRKNQKQKDKEESKRSTEKSKNKKGFSGHRDPPKKKQKRKDEKSFIDQAYEEYEKDKAEQAWDEL